MKEEVEQLLGGEAVEQAPAETRMRGFVRSLARYILGGIVSDIGYVVLPGGRFPDRARHLPPDGL